MSTNRRAAKASAKVAKAPSESSQTQARRDAAPKKTSPGAKPPPRAAGRSVARETAPGRAGPRPGAARKQATGSTGDKAVPQPALLAGGNPQIAKGYGDAPVQAYIAAMPGWKREIGRQLDALIVSAVPDVAKAVKWNSPLYGIEGQGWFLGIHCYTHYVKVAFFRGARLRPPPPGPSKSADTRYLDIREDEPIDQARLVEWVRQASRLPGEHM